jgi:hypothetical protein
MKKYLLYLTIFAALLIVRCDKPGPTELVSDETFEVEVLGKDLENEFYSNGYDTSGVPSDYLEYSSYVAVSGIKKSYRGKTDRISSAQAFIFDKSRPFYSASNILIGYYTIIPGIISFNDTPARITNYRIKFRENGLVIDTVLGKKYELFNLNNRPLLDNFNFQYNSAIQMTYKEFLSTTTSSIDIITPRELTGNIKIIRNENSNNFDLEVRWDGDLSSNFYLIVGGIRISGEQPFPFYKIKTNDDGVIVIPASLLKNIPRDKFNRIAVTLVRKYQKFADVKNGNLFIVSQSIHTIIADLP